MSTSFVGVLHSSPAGPALLPLLGASAILAFDAFETVYFSTFVRTSASEIPDHAIAAFWERSLTPALISVFALYGGTALLSGLVWKSAEPGSLLRTYVGYGSLFSFGHFAYVYSIAKVVEEMVQQPTTAREGQKTWLRIHAVRTLTTDIPAFLCFLACVWHGWN